MVGKCVVFFMSYRVVVLTRLARISGVFQRAIRTQYLHRHREQGLAAPVLLDGLMCRQQK
jgi:hypothetical protein